MSQFLMIYKEESYGVTIDQMESAVTKCDLVWQSVNGAVVFICDDDEDGKAYDTMDEVCRELDNPNIGAIELAQMCDASEI